MTWCHPRRLLGFLFFILMGGLVAVPSSSDMLAQRKGGQKEGKSRGKAKEDVPPNVTLPESWTKAFTWRSIGPASMSGRITAISVYEADPSTYWVATASGGLLKTTNNGVTFVHQFDKERTVSIGDVCVAPSNKDIIWVGTGENNPRNSVSYGDGVYKSTDGGNKWKHMGLGRTYQIGKIIVHPQDPDVVYVGALGRLYGSNEERGLYKTTDGGETWQKIFYTDPNTGVIDMRMDPTNPDVLYVAMWERRRDEFDSWPGGNIPDGYDSYDPVKKWGPTAGIYKTIDGGKSFRKLTNGLPTCEFGRVGLDIYRKDPNTIFAIVDCAKIGMGTAPKRPAASTVETGFRGDDAEGNGGALVTRVFEGGPADTAGLKADDIITKIGDKTVTTYEAFSDIANAGKAGDKLLLQVKRGEKKEVIELTLAERQTPKGGLSGGGFGGPGGATRTRPNSATYGGQAANVQDRQGPNSHEYGGVYKSTDGGETWKRINSINPRPMYFSQIRVDPSNDQILYVLGVSLARSTDGGKSFSSIRSRGDMSRIHADQHALWIDPKDGRHMIVGTDGGFYTTYDRGENWDHHNFFALGQFYHVAVCSKKPYWVYGGLQDNGCWGQPSMSLRGAILNEDVISLNGGDGYVCRVDPNDPDQIYAESQNGGMVRYHLKTGERASIQPRPPQTGLDRRGPMPMDAEAGKDSKEPKAEPKEAKEPKEGRPTGRYRFNWNTPYILSHHNSHILYSGGDFIFKSVKKGDDPKIISPEISRTRHGTATALAESPLKADVLWAGTDDGNIWITRNGGKDWTNVADKVGLKKPLWVATIEASRFAEGRAYVAFDAHRSDDDSPYLYMTDDFGQTWKPITNNLPVGSTRCLREDIINPNLLYCGTEFALYVSLNRGRTWTKLNNNLPTVAVHEVAVHPTAGEIVAATHGRSLWILDVTALRQMASKKVTEEVTLYKPNGVTRWQSLPSRARSGRRFIGENPRPGAHIFYSLPKKAESVTIEFQDIDGKKVAELRRGVPTDAGLHAVTWNTRRQPPPGPGGAGDPGGGGRGGRFGGGRIGPAVPEGAYRVVLHVDGKDFAQSFTIKGDPVEGRNLTFEESEEEGDADKDR